MKILGDEEAVTEGNVKFLTAMARHTGRFPSVRKLAKIAGPFVPECVPSELATWASCGFKCVQALPGQVQQEGEEDDACSMQQW